MASGKKKLLVAGLLTAVAAGAFYTFSGNDKGATTPPPEPDATAIYQKIDQYDYIMAESKDHHFLNFYVDVPQLSNGGTTTDAALAKDIRAQSRMALMQGMIRLNKADVAANVSTIESNLAEFLRNNVTVGVKDGALIPAVEGVNYAAPRILKIVDGKTQTVLFELPAAAAPAYVAPAQPKPPGGA